MKARYWVFSILLALAANCLAQDIPLSINVDGGDLHGSLLLPDDDPPFPIVLLHPGSGPTDRDGNNSMMKNDSLKQLAQGLAEKGIASLRIDKRGIGESRDAAKSEEELRFETYAKDLTAWLNLLDEDSRFSSTTLLGHSEGSLVGGVALVKFNAPADGIISLAGAGFPAGVVLRQQMAERLPETLNQESNHILDSLEQGELVEDPNPALYVLYRPSVQPYMISWLQYDPAQIYAEIKQPVLIIQGSSDIQVSENDANRLAEAGPHTLQVIDGMNHVLKQVDGDLQSQLPSYSDPEIPLHPELVGVVVGFVEGL